MGKKINCFIKGCENVYNIYFCPYCKKTNYGDGSPIAGENLTCKFCREQFAFVNCFYCKQINFWKKPNIFNFYIKTTICTVFFTKKDKKKCFIYIYKIVCNIVITGLFLS